MKRNVVITWANNQCIYISRCRVYTEFVEPRVRADIDFACLPSRYNADV